MSALNPRQRNDNFKRGGKLRSSKHEDQIDSDSQDFNSLQFGAKQYNSQQFKQINNDSIDLELFHAQQFDSPPVVNLLTPKPELVKLKNEDSSIIVDDSFTLRNDTPPTVRSKNFVRLPQFGHF